MLATWKIKWGRESWKIILDMTKKAVYHWHKLQAHSIIEESYSLGMFEKLSTALQPGARSYLSFTKLMHYICIQVKIKPSSSATTVLLGFVIPIQWSRFYTGHPFYLIHISHMGFVYKDFMKKAVVYPSLTELWLLMFSFPIDPGLH